MSDDDLIRRGDLLAMFTIPGRDGDRIRDAFRAIPARGVKPQDILNAAWRDDLGPEGQAMYSRILAVIAQQSK